MASVAAGNAGVSVLVNGFFYGKASGMAPRARYVGFLDAPVFWIFIICLFLDITYIRFELLLINVFVFCRIAVYKAIFPSVGTLADVIAAIDQVSVTSVLKLIS